MKFESTAHEQCYQKVSGWMKEIYGEQAMMHDEIPQIGMRAGTTFVTVTVFPWGDDDAFICARSWVVTGAETSQDLLRYLLQKNLTMIFGAFGMDEDGDIFFDHTIVGSTCDKGELRASVSAVASTADRLDEEITQRWGGQKMTDRMR